MIIVLWPQVNTRSSISFTFLLQQLSSACPHCQTIVDGFDGKLPIPHCWFFFSSAFIQHLTLAGQLKQLNHMFQADTKIDTYSLCILANLYGIGNLKKTTATVIQIKCHLFHEIAIQDFSTLSFLLQPSTPKTLGTSQRDKWFFSPLTCSLS